MPKRKAYAVVTMTIQREIELEVDENATPEEMDKAVEKILEEKYVKFQGEEDGVDNPDEFEILELDWAD